MRREVKFALLFVVLSVTLPCVPVASATSITIDPHLYATTKAADETADFMPMATCRIGAKIYSRQSRNADANATNMLLPECPNATDIGMLSQLLAVLNEGDISGGVNAITTGINTGLSTGTTAVVGSMCGSSGTCLASPTPASTVPEPGTLGLLGTGLLGLGAFARRRFLPF